jgi:ribosome biogenesis GTPase A
VEQRIALAKDFDLYDTPGMLWPRIVVEQSGWHLAASGAVGKNAYDEVEVALHLLASVRGPYAARLQERYKLAAAEGLTDEELLTEVGRKRSALLPGGRVHLHKAAELAIADFRTGAWGRITLETPADFVQWQAEGDAKELARQAKAAARLAKKPPQRQLP